jgi:uncharacterized lipoprotein YajG
VYEGSRRCRLPIALLGASVLAACQAEPTVAPNANATGPVQPDPVKRTTTEAMCGTPSDRAHAISRVAEDTRINSVPDEVYDVAADIAEKGCPPAKR